MDGFAETKKIDENTPVMVRGSKMRRFLAELADLFLALILAMTLYGLAFQQLFGYKRYTAKMVEKTDEMNTILISRSLARNNVEGPVISGEDTFTDWVNYYVNLTSETDEYKKEYLKTYYIEKRHEDYAKLTQFEYNTSILGLPDSLTGDNNSPFFVYDGSAIDPLNADPRLNDATFAAISGYLAGNTDYLENATRYKQLKDFYSETYSKAAKEVTLKDDYKAIVLELADAMWTRVYLQSAAIIASYIISSIIIFILIPMIKVTGISIGKRVAKLEVVDRSGESIKWWQILIRGLVQTVVYSLFLPFAGFLEYGPDVITMPLLKIGESVVTMGSVIILGGLLSIASVIFMFVTSENQTLHDLASMTVVNSSDIVKINAERNRLANLANQENEG